MDHIDTEPLTHGNKVQKGAFCNRTTRQPQTSHVLHSVSLMGLCAYLHNTVSTYTFAQMTLSLWCLLPFLLDRHSGASAEVQKEEEKKFKEVGEAFSVLSDAKKKTRYDSGQDLDDDGMNMGGQHLGQTFGWEVFVVKRARFLL